MDGGSLRARDKLLFSSRLTCIWRSQPLQEMLVVDKWSRKELFLGRRSPPAQETPKEKKHLG